MIIVIPPPEGGGIVLAIDLLESGFDPAVLPTNTKSDW